MSVLTDSAGTVLLDQSGDPLLDQGPPPPRTRTEIVSGLMRCLLPPGWAFPDRTDSSLGSLLNALGVCLEALEADVAELALEISPRQSVLLLSEYEAVLGADPCGTDPSGLSLSARQAADNARWVGAAGVSEAFFRDLAAAAGVSVSFEEPEPPVCNATVCGGDVCGTDALRFVWIVTLPSTGTGLECAFRRNCPPDLTLVFRYGGTA